MKTKTKNTELINTRITKKEKAEFEIRAAGENRKPASLLRILIQQYLTEAKTND